MGVLSPCAVALVLVARLAEFACFVTVAAVRAYWAQIFFARKAGLDQQLALPLPRNFFCRVLILRIRLRSRAGALTIVLVIALALGTGVVHVFASVDEFR